MFGALRFTEMSGLIDGSKLFELRTVVGREVGEEHIWKKTWSNE
jgi:hypothetical protein